MTNQIQKEIGDNVKLVNTGIISAKDTKIFLEENNLENDLNNIGSQKFYVSDDFKNFKDNAKFLGIEI